MENTHYSLAFQPAKLNRWAIKEAKRLANIFVNTKGLPILVFTGLSGISTATALSVELNKYRVKFGMAYIRKPRENTHGTPIECTTNGDRAADFYFVFVDDFVSMGDTASRCFKQASTRFGKPLGVMFSLCQRGCSDAGAESGLKEKYGRIKEKL